MRCKFTDPTNTRTRTRTHTHTHAPSTYQNTHDVTA